MSQLVKLQEVNGKSVVATTSLKIAEVFEKEHFHVIRDIETEINKGLFNQSNFGVSSYKDSSGKSNKMYILDEEFTTFITMGFTGSKADQWKLQYIRAFNAMKNEIHKRKELHPADEFAKYHALAGLLGLKKEQAAIHANHATRNETGKDVLALMELKFEVESKTMSITNHLHKAGIKLTPAKANLILLNAGYLTGKPGEWKLTELGETIGKLVSQESNGKMRESIEWTDEVIYIIQSFI